LILNLKSKLNLLIEEKNIQIKIDLIIFFLLISFPIVELAISYCNDCFHIK